MINDWKYCIVQIPRSCFCPSCFFRVQTANRDRPQRDRLISFSSCVGKKFSQGDSKNGLQAFACGANQAHSIVLPFKNKLQMAETKYRMVSDPWKQGRWLLENSVLLDFLSAIQVHCYLWSCPTLCFPRCVWEMGGPQWPLRDAS